MHALLIVTAREQALAAAWDAFLADLPMTWVQA